MKRPTVVLASKRAATALVATEITAQTVECVFRSAFRETARGRGRPLPSGIDFAKIASELSLPWVADYKHGRWELMLAIRVVLDDGPRIVEAERRNTSDAAHQRADAYDRLVQAAQGLSDAGIIIPQLGDRPPKTASSPGQRTYHKEWRFVFALVNKELGGAQGRRSVGMTEDSLAVIISCGLLAKLGFGDVSPAGLSKMLKRGEASRVKVTYDRSRLNRIRNDTPNRDK